MFLFYSILFYGTIKISPLSLYSFHIGYHAGIHTQSDLLNKATNMEFNEICQLYKVKVNFI